MQHRILVTLLGLAGLLSTSLASAQWAVYEKPTAADWAALAELPDFSGVWERGGGGRGRGGGSALSPTPEYAALRDELLASATPGQSPTVCRPACPASCRNRTRWNSC